MALAEKCLELLLIPTMLVILFVFARQKFHQVILAGAIFVAGVVVLRLFRLRSGDPPLLANEAYFLAAIGLLYGLVWLGTRYLNARSRTGTNRRR